MKLSLSQAAIEVGKPKSTISRSIKSGRMSAVKVGNKYEIDPSELFRVFPKNVAQPQIRDEPQPPSTPSHLEVKIELLREMLERERETVDDLRKRLTRAELISDQRAEAALEPEPRRKWFWQR